MRRTTQSITRLAIIAFAALLAIAPTIHEVAAQVPGTVD